MKGFDPRSLGRAAEKVRVSPQILLTVVVAVAIFASFVYTAGQFASIARDAQDRLVNVRVGSLQDAFAPLAALFIDDEPRLRSFIVDLVAKNPTIVEFLVVRQRENGWIVATSADEREVGTNIPGYDFVLSLATSDPENSFTVEEVENNERFFRTARAVRAPDGSVLGVILTRQTLSEADRQIASSIATSYAVLFGILIVLLILFFHHARIIDYTELYRRLKEIDSLKDDFVSMVSHELRSPVAIIRGYVAELKESGAAKPAPPEVLERIDQSAQALNILIGDILDVARIEQGRIALAMKAIDPHPVVAVVLEGFAVTAKAKGLVLSAELPKGVRIEADEDRLRQVVTNLISNAIKYSDKGGIAVTGSSDGTLFTLRVSDAGIGMSAEEQAKLFGKFYRVPGDRVRQEVGTGLGLWITKQLVEAMKGTISVESIKGVGTHFVVAFPLAP
ncbi:MAG: ATP-binding protein [Patescibacteria group bacterium]